MGLAFTSALLVGFLVLGVTVSFFAVDLGVVEVELAKALKNSNFFEVAKLSTTERPTLDNFSRLTIAELALIDCWTLVKSKDSLACNVNCSMLKKSSWAVTSSKVEVVVDGSLVC